MDEIKIREKIHDFERILCLSSEEDNVRIINDEYFDSLLNLELEDIVLDYADDSFTLFRPHDKIYVINPHIYGNSYNEYGYNYSPISNLDSIIVHKSDLKEFQILRRNHTMFIVGIYKTYPCKWFAHHEDGEDSLICHYEFLFYGVIDDRDVKHPHVYDICKHEMYSKLFVKKEVTFPNQSQPLSSVEKYVISPETMALLLSHHDEIIYGIPTSIISFYPMFISKEFFGRCRI